MQRTACDGDRPIDLRTGGNRPATHGDLVIGREGNGLRVPSELRNELPQRVHGSAPELHPSGLCGFHGRSTAQTRLCLRACCGRVGGSAARRGRLNSRGLLSHQRSPGDREDQRQNGQTHGNQVRRRRAVAKIALRPTAASTTSARNPVIPTAAVMPPTRRAVTAASPNVLAMALPTASNRATRTRCPARSKKNRKASSRTAVQTAATDTTSATTAVAAIPATRADRDAGTHCFTESI